MMLNDANLNHNDKGSFSVNALTAQLYTCIYKIMSKHLRLSTYYISFKRAMKIAVSSKGCLCF